MSIIEKQIKTGPLHFVSKETFRDEIDQLKNNFKFVRSQTFNKRQFKIGLGFFIILSVVSYVALGVTLWMTKKTGAQLVDISVSETKAELTEMKVEMMGLKSELVKLKKNVQKFKTILPFTSTGLSWEGNPVKLGWIKSTSGVQSFNLPDALPMNASMVRIIAFHRSGNEGSSREVLYRLWTEVSGAEHVHFLYGWRYPQSAISFQAPEFCFPIEKTDRTVKASRESIQPSNDHGVFLYVSGYKK
eukprot:GFUD01008194.1.p1 GENE.GFUD01008194.1~~GFUD01008194.1.p1  ORF type:complete len:252 (+),score=49.96 GFUD01008194.1:24-758(+)